MTFSNIHIRHFIDSSCEIFISHISTSDMSRNMVENEMIKACNLVHTQIINKQEYFTIVSLQIFSMKAMAANFLNGQNMFHIFAEQYSDANMKLCT